MTMTAIIAPEPAKESEEKEKETRNNYSVDQPSVSSSAYCLHLHTVLFLSPVAESKYKQITWWIST